MLLLLIKYLTFLNIKLPAVFTYASTRMILSAATTLILTIFLGPWFIRKLYEMKIGQPIRDKNECPMLAELHSKKNNTPTMGGVLILFSMFISLFLWMDLSNIFTLIFLFSTLFLGALGGVDDYLKLKKKNSKGIRPRVKFIFQFLIAAIVAYVLLFSGFDNNKKNKFPIKYPIIKERVENKKMQEVTFEKYMGKIYVPFIKKAVFNIDKAFFIFLFIFYIFIIVGSSNAVNLTDGLDGLAAGCLIMVSAVLGVFAFVSNNIEIARYLNIIYIEGASEIAIYLLALSGATLGFLWYNGFPAQIFMGDIGSLSLGGIIGLSAILLKRELLLVILGGIFVMEALSVIFQVLSYKYRNKKRIFLCSPLHHHFEYKGWAEQKVVMRFWIIGFLLALISLSSLKFQ